MFLKFSGLDVNYFNEKPKELRFKEMLEQKLTLDQTLEVI
jgi:hypothetical protein